MKIVKEKITVEELREMAKKMFGSLVKAMVDIEKKVMAVDAGVHADLMDFLIKQEKSKPNNLWGVNIYPNAADPNFIEFDSMMNIKPSVGNKTRGVENEEIRNKIITIVNKLIER